MTVSLTRTPRVPVPADVRDNSETVTDYAFMRHHSPDRGVATPDYRDHAISYGDLFGYTLYSWHDVNQGTQNGWGAGQRCRFDMLVNREGRVVHLFHTEYWTRVTCAYCADNFRAQSYAAYYVTEEGGTAAEARPLCDEHIAMYRRLDGVEFSLSERLLVGQHD